MCILSKIDQIFTKELAIIYKVLHYLAISAHHHWTFENLLENLWDYFKPKKIYANPKSQLTGYIYIASGAALP